MKKIFNLIPIVSTTLLPIATVVSCSNSNFMENYYMYDMLDSSTWPTLPEPYEKKIEVTQTVATDTYVNEINKDKSIFISDYIYGCSHYKDIIKDIYPNRELTALEIGLTLPTFGATNIWQIGLIDKPSPTISFKSRIHLVFEEKTNDGSHISEDVLINIEYNDVIFLVTEGFNRYTRWNIGILDPMLQLEAFWDHEYNINPWNIRYGCILAETKTIEGEEGTPDVKIHNTEYYSGELKTADHLYSAYTAAHSASSTASSLEKTILMMLMMEGINSHYFGNVPNQASIRLSSPLTATVKPGDYEVDFYGLQFIPSNSDNIDTTKPAIINAVTENPITLTLEDSDLHPNEIQIDSQGVSIDDPLDIDYRYPLKGTLLHPFTDDDLHDPIKIFRLPISLMNFGIQFTDKSGKPKREAVTVNMHYNSVLVTVVS